MVSGPKQHIIPKVYSKRFASAQGLFMYDKSRDVVHEKRKQPSGILWADCYYGPPGNHFDEQVLQPIEDRLGEALDDLLDPESPSWSPQVGEVLEQFVASLLVRTEYLPAVALRTDEIRQSFASHALEAGLSLDEAHGRARQFIGSAIFTLFHHNAWGWRRLHYDAGYGIEVVFSDHPVATIADSVQGTRVLLVPVSKHVVVVGGPDQFLDDLDFSDLRRINLTIAGFAKERVYSGDLETLRTLQSDLGEIRKLGDSHPLSYVFKPFGGAAEGDGPENGVVVGMAPDEALAAICAVFQLDSSPPSADERRGSSMAVKPLEDRVLVKPIEKESMTSSGLYLPEASKEKPIQGKVVAVGPGKVLENGTRAAMTIKKGDTVVYSKYAGTEVEIEGKDHLILRETELLGVVS